MTDDIEKTIQIAAPPSRVWHALTDHAEFGTWFRVRLDGPFAEGELSTGHMTYPGYEHLRWRATVREITPERRFVYTWEHLRGDGTPVEGETTVTFTLEPVAGGTRVTVRESGFDALTPDFRADARRQNEGGWEEQVQNIKAHVEAG